MGKQADFELPLGDHPREYGENDEVAYRMAAAQGSSPRIRGEFKLASLLGPLHGIIPANTGRIPGRWPKWACGRDHPREYGENYNAIGDHVVRVGSSPRIRGEYLEELLIGRKIGIIPANTGRIFTRPVCLCWGRDHPREYGENGPEGWDRVSRAGSSPRIRGEFRCGE